MLVADEVKKISSAYKYNESNPLRVHERSSEIVQMSGWYRCSRIWFFLLASCGCGITTTSQALRIPEWVQTTVPFTGSGKTGKKHTPLLFLTVPPGIIPECDAMEAVVRQIERENPDIRVQRLDILRHPENEALLHVLAASATTTSSSGGSRSTLSATPPLLYHRESCQTIQIKPSSPAAASGKSKSSAESKKIKPPAIYVDKARVRAWARGRIGTQAAAVGGSHVSRNAIQKNQSPITTTTSSENTDPEAFEMLEDLALTETQRKGKRLIQKRTEKQALKEINQ